MKLSRQQLSVLILSLMATSIGQSLVFAILAPLGREVAMSELQITSIIATSALVFGLVSPWWGRLSDRIGRKPVIIVGLVGYTIGTVAFTSVFWGGMAGILSGTLLYVVALVTRCGQSMVMSAAAPATAAYAADHTSPDQRTGAMAKLGTANSLGTILGPAVSGALAALGLLAPLYFAGLLSAFAALLIWRWLPVTPSPQIKSRVVKARLKVRDPRIFHYLLTAVSLFVGFSGIQQTLGFQLQDKMQLSGIQTAQYTGGALMVLAIFTFFSQMTLMQRLQWPPLRFIRVGLSLILLGGIGVTLFQAYWQLAVGMAFMGLGMGLMMPAISAGASLAVTAEEQGAVAGLVSSCPALGFAVGPIVAGALYQWMPVTAAMFSCGVFVVLLGWLMLRR